MGPAQRSAAVMTPEILILDGGLGTSLIRKYNVKFNDGTPLWTSHLVLSDRETLLRCQRDFGNLPVDIMLTATYQISTEAFAKTRTKEFPSGIPSTHIPDIINDVVRVAEEAKQNTAKLALSVGPYGAIMNPSQEYSGEYDQAHSSMESLHAWHTERLKLFTGITDIRSRLGYISFETLPRSDEIKATRKALDDTVELAGIPFWTTCVYPDDKMTLPSGESVREAVDAMLNPKVAKATPWGVGINCTNVWKLDKLLREYENAISDMIREGQVQQWPALVLYPDGVNGEKFNYDTMRWELPEDERYTIKTPWEEQVAQVVRATQDRGNWPQIVVGGCCLSTSDTIGRLRSLLIPE
ncbi:Homocysteine S-methyltransferase [Penicillium camemberti]|uniref:Homocysteine S-methyltransferase n=1 Tax=Penicillium camemberti (strain FM 013) TaxID=1429867 RepID=A0A0G4NZD8_PENC3|nr:Homocysteine S-methyltransferase [Penicillium camemberti]